MKILFPSVFFLPQTIGGIELYIFHLATALKKMGHEVKVLVPSIAEEAGSDYFYSGLEVLRYQSRPPANRRQYAGLEADEGCIEAFKKILLREQPDIIHFNQLTNSSGISLFHIMAAKQTGARVVYSNHLAEFICQRGDLRYMGIESCDGVIIDKKCTECLLATKGMYKHIAKMVSYIDDKLVALPGRKNFAAQLQPIVFPGFFIRWHTERNGRLLASVDAFVSIAGWSSKLLEANGWLNEKCVTVKAGLPPQENIGAATAKPYNGQSPLRLVFMGRIFPVKGLDILISALKKLPEDKVELSIYGPRDSGIYSSYYDECVQAAGHSENIIFHGPVDNNKVVSILSSHHLLVMPSRGNEMAPLVIQEAYRAGIPVIGSDLPAIREWVTENSNGLIFTVEDAVSLADKIKAILQKPSLLEAFKKNIPPTRSFAEVADEYQEIYKQLIQIKYADPLEQ